MVERGFVFFVCARIIEGTVRVGYGDRCGTDQSSLAGGAV